MNETMQARLDRLEMLYSNQDYTIQTLNDTVAQQDQEISRLNLSIEQLKLQLSALKTEVVSEISLEPEKPPHY